MSVATRPESAHTPGNTVDFMITLPHLRKSHVSAELAATIGSRFNEHELRIIGRLGTAIQIPSGKRFVTENTFGREALIIIDGTARVVHEDEDGLTIEIASAGRGDIVGEAALVSGNRRNATVIAETDLKAIVFNVREFRSLLDQSPRLSSEVEQLIHARQAN